MTSVDKQYMMILKFKSLRVFFFKIHGLERQSISEII